MLTMFFLIFPSKYTGFPSRRIRSRVFFVAIWRLFACARFTSPFEFTLKRFLTADLVFNLYPISLICNWGNNIEVQLFIATAGEKVIVAAGVGAATGRESFGCVTASALNWRVRALCNKTQECHVEYYVVALFVIKSRGYLPQKRHDLLRCFCHRNLGIRELLTIHTNAHLIWFYDWPKLFILSANERWALQTWYILGIDILFQ